MDRKQTPRFGVKAAAVMFAAAVAVTLGATERAAHAQDKPNKVVLRLPPTFHRRRTRRASR